MRERRVCFRVMGEIKGTCSNGQTLPSKLVESNVLDMFFFFFFFSRAKPARGLVAQAIHYFVELGLCVLKSILCMHHLLRFIRRVAHRIFYIFTPERYWDRYQGERGLERRRPVSLTRIKGKRDAFFRLYFWADRMSC